MCFILCYKYYFSIRYLNYIYILLFLIHLLLLLFESNLVCLLIRIAHHKHQSISILLRNYLLKLNLLLPYNVHCWILSHYQILSLELCLLLKLLCLLECIELILQYRWSIQRIINVLDKHLLLSIIIKHFRLIISCYLLYQLRLNCILFEYYLLLI